MNAEVSDSPSTQPDAPEVSQPDSQPVAGLPSEPSLAQEPEISQVPTNSYVEELTESTSLSTANTDEVAQLSAQLATVQKFQLSSRDVTELSDDFDLSADELDLLNELVNE